MKNIGCILLAAGAGARFGGSKLFAFFNGRPVIEYILGNVRDTDFSHRAIVAANDEMLDTARRFGFAGVVNDCPELGVSRSIRMGLDLMSDTDACMFCVADQPLLGRDTLSGMLESYEPGTILAVSHNEQSGNPVIYPARLYGELSRLEGEESGKTVASRYKSLLRHFYVADALQLEDIDTREDLTALQERIGSPDIK